MKLKKESIQMSTRIIRILGLILSSIVLWVDQGYSGLPAGTLVATRCGLMPIEKLKRGDKVLSYDLNETNPDEIIVDVAITNISKHEADSVFTLCTAEGGFIDASPQQLFFTLTAKSNQSDEPLIMDFV